MYIDPAAGSLILQVLAAGVLSAVAAVKGARNAAKRLIRGLLHRQRDP